VSDKVVVAAFDVDGTLTTRDCVRPFLERVAGRRRLVTSVLRRPLATLAARSASIATD
jgi:phosphatidylglycerophosphatase C